jgi:hypothetical protein
MIRLQERTNNLYSSPSGSLGPRLRHFVAWLDSEPFFSTTLSTLPMPEADGDSWLREHLGRFSVDFPPDEDEAVGCCWLVARRVADDDDAGTRMYMATHEFSEVHDIASGQRAFLDTFVEPVVVWLRERILTDDHILHSVQRYAYEAAWFRRDELRASYEDDTGVGEKTLDRDLRRHLFREGIDFPFSQTHGPSGIPDIVVPDVEAQPLPLEVKVFDPAMGRDKAHVRSGFVQAIEYAHDYRRADAYLPVFDVTTEGLSVQGDDPKSNIPYVRSSGVTVFIVVIPIGEPQAASGRGRVQRTTLDSAYLVAEASVAADG